MITNNNKNQNNKKQKKNKRQRNRNNTTTRDPRMGSTLIRRQNIMPDIRVATLTYCDASTIRNFAGASFLVYSMRINDLYDPDPLVLSGSVSNFKEMMQFYSFYRVRSCSIKWQVANNETFSMSFGIVFSPTNLVGSIATKDQAQDAFENDFVTSINIASGKGGMDRTEFDLPKLSIAELLGAKEQYRSDVNYTGLGLATPSTPLWANFISFTPSNSVAPNGYSNITTLSFEAEFFGRINVRA